MYGIGYRNIKGEVTQRSFAPRDLKAAQRLLRKLNSTELARVLRPGGYVIIKL